MACPRCWRDFPEHCIQPLRINDQILECCPLCALKLLGRTEFVHPEARVLHQLALKHLENK